MKFLRFFAILVTNSHFLRPVLLLKPLLHRFHGKFSTFLLKKCETKTCEIPHCALWSGNDEFSYSHKKFRENKFTEYNIIHIIFVFTEIL